MTRFQGLPTGHRGQAMQGRLADITMESTLSFGFGSDSSCSLVDSVSVLCSPGIANIFKAHHIVLAFRNRRETKVQGGRGAGGAA